MNNSKKKNFGTIIIIVLLVLIGIGLVGGIYDSIVTKVKGTLVNVRITDLDDYEDAEYMKHHVIFGEIITEGDYKGKKVRFETTFENNYKVNDIIRGKFYNGNFQVDKE